MSWNIADNRNLFLKLKTKSGLYHVELRCKDSPEKNTLTLIETQQLPDIENTDSKDQFSCLSRQFKMVGEKCASTFKLIQTR